MRERLRISFRRHHSVSLLCYGAVYIFSGLPLVLDAVSVASPPDHPALMGLQLWGAGFLVAGLISLASSFLQTDKLGFVALSAVGWSWLAYDVGLWILHLTFYPGVGVVNWLAMATNSALMVKIWLDAGWGEPVEISAGSS